MKCEKCHKELPTLGDEWTTVFCHYLGRGVDLCTDCYDHFEKAFKVFEHEFLTGSPRECATLNVAVRNVDKEEVKRELLKQIRAGNVQLLPAEEPKDRWIPIKLRPGTDEEYEEFCKYGDCPREDFRVFECPLPDDDQEVLVTTRWGHVCIDIWHRDVDCCYFETYCDDDDVIAWMPLPEPYKKEGEEE